MFFYSVLQKKVPAVRVGGVGLHFGPGLRPTTKMPTGSLISWWAFLQETVLGIHRTIYTGLSAAADEDGTGQTREAQRQNPV